MAEFDENDLLNQDYEDSTTEGDDPDYIGIRDRKRVNKKEKYEVIDFCNAFLQDRNFKNKATFQHVEKLIRLPEASGFVMRDKLNEFVVKNWNKSM